ncbi:MAG: hypothetical protein NT154_27430 [Verrucomicrobia bacterium]|nr:hypothetical protein [Verrucomicrobiota bacterium]
MKDRAPMIQPAMGVACLLMLLLGAPGAEASNKEALGQAIRDLAAGSSGAYPHADEYLHRLAAARTEEEFQSLQREALVANPLVSGQPILFVRRPQYVNTHGPDETMYQRNEPVVAGHFRGGSQLKVLDPASGTTRVLLDVPQGIARDPVVHFDGRRILFSMRREAQDDYHLYEIDSDGTHLRQLTFAPNVSDIQPVYLPNGRILFSSTREPKYIHCQRHLMASLFLMEADGANIHQIGYNTLFEGRSSLLPDGRVLYSRWEYVDKHFSSAYGLWTTNPDGTGQSLLYGGLTWQPGAMLDARSIPGSSQVVCVFGSVHDNEWGALVLVDPHRGGDGPATWIRTWPADIRPRLEQWNVLGRVGSYDSFVGVVPKYAMPHPLSEKHFLCSRTLAPDNLELGLFLVDVFGNEVLLHRESPGCFQPMPLAARPRPPVIPDRIDPKADTGLFYVADVYQGEAMAGVRRGAVKTIRIVEAPAKLTYPAAGIGDWAAPGDGESHHPTAVCWNHYNSKRVLGTVPVEADGSAYFEVPARRFVYFQLLDESGMMIQSMRSGTSLLPGEKAGCVGCHAYQSSPPGRPDSVALRRGPSGITPWYGPARDFSYAAEVQPVLDRQCVSCHDFGKGPGEKQNLSGDLGLAFNASYVTLMASSPALWHLPKPGEPKPLISIVGTGPLPVVPPYSWGSHRSRLVDLLRAGHEKVKLSPEEFDRIVTWIDLNAPYYARYEDYYTANTWGRSPLDHQQLLRLGQLVSAAPEGKRWGWSSVTEYIGGSTPPGSLMASGELPVNFTRPERSACLRAFPTPEQPGYTEALALIRAGQSMLAEHPRADMAGFQPCAADQERLNAWRQRREMEEGIWQALREGRQVYDASHDAGKPSQPPGKTISKRS